MARDAQQERINWSNAQLLAIVHGVRSWESGLRVLSEGPWMHEPVLLIFRNGIIEIVEDKGREDWYAGSI